MNSNNPVDFGFVFYFDESQKTDALQIKDGRLTFDNIDDLHSFVGIFCGYPIDKVDSLSESMATFETVWKKKFNLSPEQELKSTNIKRKTYA